MSLFIDVVEPLSSTIKLHLREVIESLRKDQPRSIRRISETCNKYLDYGELRYDKMEDGIKELNEIFRDSGGIRRMDPLHIVLFAVMQESLDEDETALAQFTDFAETIPARSFREELLDFITLGKFATLKQYDLLETAGTLIVDRYSDESSITDKLSNMYLQVEKNEYIPVILLLLSRAREKYPTMLALESLTGFMHIRSNEHQAALNTFISIKDKLLQQGEANAYLNDNLASVWDNIASCYLSLGDTAKTIESCDTAMEYDEKAVAYRLGLSVLYKKAEALLKAGQKEQAGVIANQILAANPEDETALELKSKI